MKVKCIKEIGDFKKDKIYDITIYNNYAFEFLGIYNNEVNPAIITRNEYDKYFNEVKDNKETTITYEIRYNQDGRNYITGMLIKDIETARKFKHEYEKLNHIGNVKIIKITEIKEEVE